jgi:hypothetical protein
MVRTRIHTAGSRTKGIYDELHGYITINDIELKIIDTPTFQRLRRIKQLAQAWFVYPGAVHTRFSHSLGVMHLMGIIANKLANEGYIHRDDVQLLKLAALLHDVGHTPYSHAVEMYFLEEYKLQHEELGIWVVEEDPYITQALKDSGYDPKEVSAIIRGKHKETLYNALLSSDIDVDRLDYLPRDALHTGVAYGLIDLDRLIQTLTIDSEGFLAVPSKAVQAIENFYIARLHMYRSVYHHKTIASYQLMIKMIYELMIQHVKDLIEQFSEPESIRKAISEGKYYLWDDFYLGGLMNYILSKELGNEMLRDLIQLYLERVGYRVTYEFVQFSKGPSVSGSEIQIKISEIEELAKNEGLSKYHIVPYMEHLPIISEEDAIRIIHGTSSLRVTDYPGSILRDIPDSMLVVRIYSHPYFEELVKSLVSKVFQH